MRIIGISGKIGSGKSTAADFLEDKFNATGSRAKQVSFAYALKKVVATLCDTSFETQLSQSGKNTIDPVLGKSYGSLQQLVGTGLRETVDPNIWIKIALDTPRSDTEILIIPDVRFKNEAQSIIDRGGFLIRMEGDPANIRKNSNRDLNHISETDLDDWQQWNLIIYNKSLNVLYSSLEKI